MSPQRKKEILNENTEKRQQVECFSRVCGYIRPVQQWNDGKRAEFDDRLNFDSKLCEE